MKTNYTYSATCLNVVDGDTVDLMVDLGFNVKIYERFRVQGIDAYESRNVKTQTGSQWLMGIEGKAFLTKMILDKTVLITTTKGKGKFGRWIADIYLENLGSVSALMVSHGYAVFKEY